MLTDYQKQILNQGGSHKSAGVSNDEVDRISSLDIDSRAKEWAAIAKKAEKDRKREQASLYEAKKDLAKLDEAKEAAKQARNYYVVLSRRFLTPEEHNKLLSKLDDKMTDMVLRERSKMLLNSVLRKYKTDADALAGLFPTGSDTAKWHLYRKALDEHPELLEQDDEYKSLLEAAKEKDAKSKIINKVFVPKGASLFGTDVLGMSGFKTAPTIPPMKRLKWDKDISGDYIPVNSFDEEGDDEIDLDIDLDLNDDWDWRKD